MASRLVLIAVLPRVMVSEAENFPNGGCVARAPSSSFRVSHAAPKPVAERIRNSRRCIKSLREMRLNHDTPAKGRATRGKTQANILKLEREKEEEKKLKKGFLCALCRSLP